MTKEEAFTQPQPLRPAPPRQQKRGGKRRSVAKHLKAVVGPRNLGQALDQAVPSRRRREIAQQSGYDAQAQKLRFEPSWRALLVRPIVGGRLPDLPYGMAQAAVYAAHGARLEMSVPALSRANAPRPAPAFWEVVAEGMAVVEALPPAVRLGRGTP
jgi:hypothetical protein